MKSKRQAITIETKYEIIKHHQGGKKLAFLVKEFNLPQSTVSTILKNKEKTILQYENNAIPSKKRIKLSTYPLLEDSWFKQTVTQTIDNDLVPHGILSDEEICSIPEPEIEIEETVSTTKNEFISATKIIKKFLMEQANDQTSSINYMDNLERKFKNNNSVQSSLM